MPNFKYVSLILFTLSISACFNFSNEEFFNTSHVNEDSRQIEYQDIHRLNLSITDLNNHIDESGFAPILKSQFILNNKSDGPWPQAWVAFNINIFIKKQKLASIAKADVMQEHSLHIKFEQSLPKFGIKPEDLTIKISPIAWMPTFPLNILPLKTVDTSSEKNHQKDTASLDLKDLP